MKKVKSKSSKTNKKGIPYYTLTVKYKVRTHEQAVELQKSLNAVFAQKVDVWCGRLLPKDWGKVNGEKF